MSTIQQLIGPDGVVSAGDVSHITGVYIVDSDGTKHNIFRAFKELNIFEDLFSPCISGIITIVDIQNFITHIPILGDETLEFEYKTPSFKESIKKIFSITKIDARTYGGDKKLVYEVHFTSQEAVYDIDTKLSKAFTGNAHEIVKTICKNELGLKDADIDIEDADNKIKFVAPWWSPFKCINYATARCLLPNSNKLVTPNYLFYQTLRAYRLKSLTTLFGQEPYATYVFDNNPMRDEKIDGTSTADIDRMYNTVISLDYIASQDRISNLLDGSLSNTVFGMNLLRKIFSVKSYRIQRDFEKTKHLDEFEISPIAVGMSRFENRTTAPQLFNNVNDVSDSIITNRIPLLGQLDIFKLNMYVMGRTDVEVGMTIDFLMNTYIPFEEWHRDEPRFKKDPYYSGKYIITAIQHKIDQFSHRMMLQVSKESSLNQIVFEAFTE